MVVRIVGQLGNQRQVGWGRGRQRRIDDPTYPVPHCSTLVMLSWRRLLSQPRSSCLDSVASSCQPLWFHHRIADRGEACWGRMLGINTMKTHRDSLAMFVYCKSDERKMEAGGGFWENANRGESEGDKCSGRRNRVARGWRANHEGSGRTTRSITGLGWSGWWFLERSGVATSR